MSFFEVHNLLNDEQFEELIARLFNCDYQTTTFQRFGKNGQKQYGVDVFSLEHKVLIQCKYKGDTSDKKKMLKTLKEDIKESIEKVFEDDSNWRSC